MPLKRNWMSGGLPAAAAFVNCGITFDVDMSVGWIVFPVSVLNFAIVSLTHASIPTASCCPHHHIFSVAASALAPVPPLVALPLSSPPPHAATMGARPVAATPPAVYLRSCRRLNGRSNCCTSDLPGSPTSGRLAGPLGG